MISCALARTVSAQNPLQPTAPPPKPPQPQAPPPPAKPAPKAATAPPQRVAYPVTSFDIKYASPVAGAPALPELLDIEVSLAVDGGTFTAPRAGLPGAALAIRDLTLPNRASRDFDQSAILQIDSAIRDYLNKRGIVGLVIRPDPAQINPDSGKDLRPAGSWELTVLILARTVEEVRTLGAGPLWSKPQAAGNAPSMETRIDNPRHERIRRNSPLQPGSNGQPGDLLRKDTLDDYLFRLNRLPGRRVDAAIASTGTPSGVVLDYIVTENKPWIAYFQVSNTGTKETDEWRERFGFSHSQLTGHDDALSVDYITAGFDASNAVIASYDRPLTRDGRLHGKVYASFNEFTASDVGFANEKFTGESWSGGGELAYTVFQRRELFIDAFGGARWEHHHVTNQVIDLEGDDDFFLPYAGLRLDRSTQIATTDGEIRVEGNLASVAGTDALEAQKLGRLGVDESWTVIKWHLNQSFFVEPLLFASTWNGGGAPSRTTLAHEVALSFRGQNALGSRLIPQEEDVIGGLYTVRGYPESLAAGDNSVIASAEYRFHLPRALSVREEPGTLFNKPFRYRPDQTFGRPDWDLIMKAFFDAGRVTNSNRQSFEQDVTLLSTGVGVELDVKQNVSIRVDLGVALRDARDVNAGDSRMHVVATFLY